ncbi:MAG: hypothetical protein ACI85O_000556 [Saprospiraceae bacterium]|jgi:hypothetical protein
MKSLFTLLFTLTTLTFLIAQNAEDCNGDRYVNKIFNEITKTTVQYGANVDSQGDFQNLYMDIYEPTNDIAAVRPAIVLGHGGSFIQGTRADGDIVALCQGFAQRGYVVASIDYRLYQLVIPNFPDSLEALDIVIKTVGDMKAAVRHLRKDAATEDLFRVDSDRIFIGGASAGAITALHAAYMDETDSIPDFLTAIIEDNGGFEGNSGDEDNQTYSSEGIAVFNLSGGIYRSDWLDENDPPLVSYHGTEDDLVPYNMGSLGARFNGFQIDLMTVFGSGSIHEQAEEIGLSNYLSTVEGGGHEEIYGSEFQLELDEFSYQSLLFYHDILCNGVEVLPSSTEDISIENTSLKVYPNPAGEFVFVEVEESLNTDKILIFNELGVLVGEKHFNEKRVQLEQKEFGDGVFFIGLQDDKGGRLPFLEKIVFIE